MTLIRYWPRLWAVRRPGLSRPIKLRFWRIGSVRVAFAMVVLHVEKLRKPLRRVAGEMHRMSPDVSLVRELSVILTTPRRIARLTSVLFHSPKRVSVRHKADSKMRM